MALDVLVVRNQCNFAEDEYFDVNSGNNCYLDDEFLINFDDVKYDKNNMMMIFWASVLQREE